MKIAEARPEEEEPGEGEKVAVAGAMGTKGRFKIGKAKAKKVGENVPQHVQFNDPLYEYLDGEVYNQEQHNFGPWLQSDRGRPPNPHPHLHSQQQLPQLTRAQDLRTRYDHYMRQPQQDYTLPQIADRNRSSSLQQLKTNALQFHPLSQLIPEHSRKGLSLSRKPNVLKMNGKEGYSLKMATENTGRKSNVIYNYCLQEEDTKLIPTKLGITRAASYLQLQTLAKEKAEPILALSKFNNETLFRELKQHRINKLK